VGIQEKILQQFQKWDREKKIVTIVIKKSILAENEMGIVELSVGHDISKVSPPSRLYLPEQVSRRRIDVSVSLCISRVITAWIRSCGILELRIAHFVEPWVDQHYSTAPPVHCAKHMLR
jgi:hypothetical protein